MTNLLATILVTLVTNQTEIPTRYSEQAYTEGFVRLPIGERSVIEKQIVTTITEVTVCRFEWLGKTREVVEQRIVSEDRKTFALEWKAQPRSVAQNVPQVWTNFVWRGRDITNAILLNYQ